MARKFVRVPPFRDLKEGETRYFNMWEIESGLLKTLMEFVDLDEEIEPEDDWEDLYDTEQEAINGAIYQIKLRILDEMAIDKNNISWFEYHIKQYEQQKQEDEIEADRKNKEREEKKKQEIEDRINKMFDGPWDHVWASKITASDLNPPKWRKFFNITPHNIVLTLLNLYHDPETTWIFTSGYWHEVMERRRRRKLGFGDNDKEYKSFRENIEEQQKAYDDLMDSFYKIDEERKEYEEEQRKYAEEHPDSEEALFYNLFKEYEKQEQEKSLEQLAKESIEHITDPDYLTDFEGNKISREEVKRKKEESDEAFYQKEYVDYVNAILSSEDLKKKKSEQLNSKENSLLRNQNNGTVNRPLLEESSDFQTTKPKRSEFEERYEDRYESYKASKKASAYQNDSYKSNYQDVDYRVLDYEKQKRKIPLEVDFDYDEGAVKATKRRFRRKHAEAGKNFARYINALRNVGNNSEEEDFLDWQRKAEIVRSYEDDSRKKIRPHEIKDKALKRQVQKRQVMMIVLDMLGKACSVVQKVVKDYSVQNSEESKTSENRTIKEAEEKFDSYFHRWV